MDAVAGSSAALVGRADELARLEAALARAQRGSAAAVFVAGEAGVGKTRLLCEVERRAREHGLRAVRGECTAFPGGAPYAPVVDALRTLARDLGPAAFDELVGAARPALARILPELGAAEAGAVGDGALARARLFRVLRVLLDRAAVDAPLVLVLEDLQWADPSTLAFLASLLSRLRDQRLLLVCTYRGDEVHRRHRLRPFLATVHRDGAAERLELGGLSPEALAAHVAAILGGPTESRVLARLHARSGGNPFFAEELLAAGAPCRCLREVLGARLARLPDDARAVLRVAATAGREPGDRLVAGAAAVPEAALGSAVAEGVLTAQAGEYAFRHALLREAAAADLLPGERAAVHIALARALRDDPRLGRDAPAAQLAHHWTAAHRLPEALAASVHAGLEAERMLAVAEAAQHFELALEIWDLVEDAEALSPLPFAAVVAHAARDAELAGEHHRAATLDRAAQRLGLV
ncbi:MAG TPA: AAA family ATPase [Solirubrobacteraceae bacterium]